MDNTPHSENKNGRHNNPRLLSFMGEYVGWEEVWVCGEKGRREVHYYLKKKDGSADLAVVGKEKSLRHISYRYVVPVADKESRVYVKLKSRREVVNWLRSIAPVTHVPNHRPFRPIEQHVRSKDSRKLEIDTSMGNKMCNVVRTMPSFKWLGSPWICRKKRMHYPSFQRNGVHIYVHDFIYVLAEEDKRLVAYLEDMYEDSRGNKMVVVRWFHKIDEVDVVLPRTYNDREIFFSLCLQDLSIECVDGLATVLSPHHYKKFLNEARHTQLEPFVCYMLFEDDGVKPFDFSEVKGYWKQDILRYLSLTTQTKRVQYPDSAGPRPKKRLCRSNEVDEQNRDSNEPNYEQQQPMTVGSRVEVLSQDSGIRGCWYRASILKKLNGKVKVKYEDIRDAVDESKNLEEWIFESKLAGPDEYGIRFTGRSIIRPILTCSQYSVANNVNVGSVVDVWWHDGWWEGIVVKKDSEKSVVVYFLGEKRELAVGHDDMRDSHEWMNNCWNKLNERPDVVSSLALPEPKTSVISCSCSKPDRVIIFDEKETRCGGRPRVVIKPKTVVAAPDLTKDDSLAQLRWKSSKKRGGRSPVHKLNYGLKTNGAVDTRVQTSEKFKISSSSRQDPDYCKSVPNSTPLFSSSAVSNLSSLVMSR